MASVSEVRQRLLVDAKRVERAGSLVMLLGVALGVLGVLGAAGAAVVSSAEVPVKAAIGLGGLVYGAIVAFVVVVQGLVLRTFGGYVQVRTDDAVARPAARPATRPADKKPARPAAGTAATAATAAAVAARSGAVAAAKPTAAGPTASGLRPSAKTG